MQQGSRNALLRVDTIPGPGAVTTPEGFEDIHDGIWLESVTVGGTQLGCQMAGGDNEAAERARQVHLESVSLVKTVDSSTTAIFNSMLTARRFPEIYIHILREHGNGELLPYFSIKLYEAAFRSQNFATSPVEGGYAEVSEEIEIVYNKIQYAYYEETWTPGSGRGQFLSATWDQRSHAMA